MKITISPFAWGRPATPSPRDAATLERLREESRWREFDAPAVYRRANVARIRINKARRAS
jgi:hypothetical protein